MEALVAATVLFLQILYLHLVIGNAVVMVTGTIILSRYKYFILNNIALLSSDVPSPHSFYSVPLQSGVWENKSIKELFIELKKKCAEYNDNMSQHNSTIKDLTNLKKAKDLDTKISDKSKNRDMNEIIKYYDTFFDKDSGNDREEGIKQLEGYLKEELSGFKDNLRKIKKDIDEIKKEKDAKKAVEDAKKAVEENKNTFFPLIPMYSPSIFRILLTIFSICISFKLIDFNLNYFIFHLPEVVIPTIITSVVLFAWECYRLYSKFRKYYKVGKIIYMFCKKKIYSFYKKL
jgi:prefoldin subunit 5